MYESFFRLKARPFAAAPVPHCYYPGGAIEQARQISIRAIERAEGPVLVIGPSGIGKTLLCRLLAAYFEAQFRVVLLSNAQICTHKALLQSILFELGLAYRDMDEGELRLQLLDYLHPNEDCPHGLLLIIDEAHTLPIRLLEEIRMLTNVVCEGQPRVRLVLAGGPRLEERFASPRLESFNQRVAARCYLLSLRREEADEYVRSQISRCGGSADAVFTDDAYRAIFQATDGIPRLLNQVCNHALTLACEAGRRQVDAARVEEAWADLQQLPAPWQEHRVETDDARAFIEFGQLDGDGAEASPVVVDGLTSDPRGRQLDPRAAADLANEPLVICEGFGIVQQIIDGTMLDAPGDPEAEPSPPVESPSEPEIEPAIDPFDTPFAEEEVVVDRFARPADSRGGGGAVATSPVDASAGTAEARDTTCELESQVTDSHSSALTDVADSPLAGESPESGMPEPGGRASGETESPDPTMDEWEGLLTLLPTSPILGAPYPPDSPMFEFTVLETSVGGGVVLDTSNLATGTARTAAHAADEDADFLEFPPPSASENDDRDLIDVYEEELDSASDSPGDAAGVNVRRMEYRDLFAQLRRPSM